MGSVYTINVKNNEARTNYFTIFQQPPVFSGSPVVYSNSLYSQALGSYAETGSILTFQIDAQFYAGLQEATSSPVIGAASGFASASRPIELSGGSGSSLDTTKASVTPLGLSLPTAGFDVQRGAFRITMPAFAPPKIYNIGTAVNVNGGVTLSNFVHAMPNSVTECQPLHKYYVATGNTLPGSVLEFASSSVAAALCDFSSGYSVIDVTLNADGTWTTQVVK
ncbi:hypothetical protein [Roseibium sp. Sym1]|uniref:hypothetical protein n=1 Tax=Roseibium sp. Sym1 TaxID=3016006 RepID=UPI0022B38D4F|nr:hypothetical protein [Roseibium sp. Sym1]